jgi:hypothetical protein
VVFSFYVQVFAALVKFISVLLFGAIINGTVCWTWWCIRDIPAFGRLRQEDHEFLDSLGYIAKLSQKPNQTKTRIICLTSFSDYSLSCLEMQLVFCGFGNCAELISSDSFLCGIYRVFYVRVMSWGWGVAQCESAWLACARPGLHPKHCALSHTPTHPRAHTPFLICKQR